MPPICALIPIVHQVQVVSILTNRFCGAYYPYSIGCGGECQEERSQHKNKAKAMALLVSRLENAKRAAR
jgi:hypothetical protein